MVICNICKKKINEKKDNYSEIVDYKKGVQVRMEFYHTKCFVEKVRGKAEDVEKAREMLSTASKVFDKLGLNNDRGTKTKLSNIAS